MPISTAFLNSCRTSINSLAELTTFRTAHSAYATASRASRPARWVAAYDDAQAGMSPAYRLHKAIRDTVVSLSVANGVSPSEIEEATRTLAGEYIPNVKRPRDAVQQAAELQKAIIEDQVS